MSFCIPDVKALILCSPLLAAACGGGGAGNVVQVDFSTADAAAMALAASYVDAAGDPASGLTRSSSFVQTGVVDYAGALRGTLEGNGVVGNLSLSVTFGTGNATGTASQLQNEATGQYAGTLQGSGSVDKTADPGLPQFTMVLAGNLTGTGGPEAATLLLDGNFFDHDSNPEGAVAGAVEGTIGGVVLGGGLFAAEN